ELGIGLDIACQIVIFIFLCELVKYLHKLPDIGSSNSLNGVFYGIAFKEYPDLVNFLYILYRKLLYEYSLVWIFNGQTFVHKLFQRLSDGASADVELFGQLFFLEPLSRREIAVADLLFEYLVYLMFHCHY